MTAYMGKDMVNGAKMITLSGKSRHKMTQRIRFFVGGALLGCVSVVSQHWSPYHFFRTILKNVGQYIFYASTIYNISSKFVLSNSPLGFDEVECACSQFELFMQSRRQTPSSYTTQSLVSP